MMNNNMANQYLRRAAARSSYQKPQPSIESMLKRPPLSKRRDEETGGDALRSQLVEALIRNKDLRNSRQ